MQGFLDQSAYLLTPLPLALMLLGTALGITVGAVPGLTGAMLIALTLPLTYSMNQLDALVLLVSMYVGAISGGLITATLLRMPGTPASIMTTLDGYPLAKSGQPGRALGLGVTASFIGGMVSFVFLALLAAPLAKYANRLGPFDYFSLVLMALVLIASVSGGSIARGILSGLLGILATMPGMNPSTGQMRLTLGYSELTDGLKLLPVLIGLFAVSQILRDILTIDVQGESITMSRRGLFMTLADWKKQAGNMLRSSLIGTWVGILPGIGANIGSVMAYSAAKRFSKDPEKFGHGSEEAIVASEAANNATVGGALIPLIAMGIPGSVIDAILLGAMILHDLQPGPLLFQDHSDVAYTIMSTFFFANIAMFVIMIASLGLLAKLASVPRALLIPIVLVFCVVGSYSLSNRMFDVWVMLAFGGIGFGMERLKIPLAPFVIGFVLAPVAEKNLGKALMLHDGSYLPMFTRPLSLVFFSVAMVLLFRPLWQRWRELRGRGVTSRSQK